MSKSLKNFITIEDALARHSARQLRFAFLLTTWNAKLDFKEASMQEVRGFEAVLNVRGCLDSSRHRTLRLTGGNPDVQNFFANVNALVVEAKANSVASDGHHHFNQPERDLLAKSVALFLRPPPPASS